MDYLKELFINEAKPALQSRSGGEPYYDKREPFLTLTKDDFTLINNGLAYFHADMQDWFTGSDKIGYEISYLVGSDTYVNTETSGDGWQDIDGTGFCSGHACASNHDGITIANGSEFNDEYGPVISDKMLITLFDGLWTKCDSFTLKIFKVDKKLMPGSLVEGMYYTNEEGQIVPIDEKYIPDSIARTSAIETIQATADAALTTANAAKAATETITSGFAICSDGNIQKVTLIQPPTGHVYYADMRWKVGTMLYVLFKKSTSTFGTGVTMSIYDSNNNKIGPLSSEVIDDYTNLKLNNVFSAGNIYGFMLVKAENSYKWLVVSRCSSIVS